jgi:hypothetical protein
MFILAAMRTSNLNVVDPKYRLGVAYIAEELHIAYLDILEGHLMMAKLGRNVCH